MILRSLTFFLFGLVVAGSPASAVPRDERTPEPRSAAARGTSAHSQPRAARAGHRSAPVGGPLAVPRDWRTVTAGGSCTRSRGVTRCRGQSLTWSQERSISGWTHGLAPAANVQANECPAGTMATLAQGHDDIVRCLPI